MRHIHRWSGAALGLAFAVACGSADTGVSPEFEEISSSSSTRAEDSEADPVSDADGSTSAVSTSNATETVELARIDFLDGTRVRFERLGEGVLVSEVFSQGTAPHLVPQPGWSAIDVFRALAPEREVPHALLHAHRVLYPLGGAGDLTRIEAAPDQEAPPSEDFAVDRDLEHNGQFQQSDGSYPFATFTAQMCPFSGSQIFYKHGDVTATHVHATEDVHTAYYALGGDIGTVTSRPCADEACSNFVNVGAGQGSSAFYDAGLACTGGGGIGCQIFGCPTICVPRKVTFSLDTRNISESIRFHHCSLFTR